MAETSQRKNDKRDVQRMLVDPELEHLPPELRWREWMGRVEVVIFAASARNLLAKKVDSSPRVIGWK